MDTFLNQQWNGKYPGEEKSAYKPGLNPVGREGSYKPNSETGINPGRLRGPPLGPVPPFNIL